MPRKSEHNIAVFSPNWLGVSETFIYSQLKALGDHGYSSIVLAQRLKESGLKSLYHGRVYLKNMNKINFYYGIIDRKLRLRKNGYTASAGQKRYWKKALNENRIELIHAHYGPGGLRILNLAKDTNIPLLTTFHGNDASAMLRKAVYVNSLRELFNYSYIITVSEFLRKRLIRLGAPEEKVICHYIGTDLTKFRFTEHQPVIEKVKRGDKLSFLQVSNFVEKKGHRYTIEAFNIYLKEYPNSELLLAGDGPTRMAMVDLVRTLNLDGKVQFLGAVSPETVAELMRNSDVFVHHSITGANGSEEGIPTVLMEAMASGIPVVSSLHAGIPELVSEGCGFLVEEKNVQEYAQRLAALVECDTLTIANRAKEKVYKRFDLKKQNNKLLDLYNNIIENQSLQ